MVTCLWRRQRSCRVIRESTAGRSAPHGPHGARATLCAVPQADPSEGPPQECSILAGVLADAAASMVSRKLRLIELHTEVPPGGNGDVLEKRKALSWEGLCERPHHLHLLVA
jgi:hypothetical protein